MKDGPIRSVYHGQKTLQLIRKPNYLFIEKNNRFDHGQNIFEHIKETNLILEKQNSPEKV